ncbi:MAG TPA: hypothetical protein PJ982_13765, partial [Lacipirellulaceae bacterium]|nr:hypothetical protein [Lacipirellulaceae bacterium]
MQIGSIYHAIGIGVAIGPRGAQGVPYSPLPDQEVCAIDSAITIEIGLCSGHLQGSGEAICWMGALPHPRTCEKAIVILSTQAKRTRTACSQRKYQRVRDRCDDSSKRREGGVGDTSVFVDRYAISDRTSERILARIQIIEYHSVWLHCQDRSPDELEAHL